MNPVIEKTLKEVASYSFERKVATGKDALYHLVNGLRAGHLKDEEIKNLLVSFAKLFVSADKDCSREEYELFKAILEIDITYDDFYIATNGGSNIEFVERMFEFIKVLDQNDRIALLVYGACIVCANGEITLQEAALIDRILAC